MENFKNEDLTTNEHSSVNTIIPDEILAQQAQEIKKRDTQQKLESKTSGTGTVASLVADTAEKLLNSGIVRVFDRSIFVMDNDSVWTTDKLTFGNRLMLTEYRNCTRFDKREIEDKILDISNGGEEMPIEKDYINFQNCRYDLSAKTIRPYNDEDIIFSKLNCSYNPDVPDSNEVVDNFLAYLTAGNKIEQLMAYELIGYMLLPDNPMQRSFMLTGQAGSGKSVFCKLVGKLIGIKNTIAATFDNLTAEGTLASLQGKPLCMVDEAEGRLDTKQIATFKMITSGGLIAARRLYSEPFSYNWNGKLLMSCNNLPRMFDSGEAVFRRLIILPCAGSTLPEEQRIAYFEDELYKHQEYIVKKAISAMHELIKRNMFSRSEASLKASHESIREANPVIQFLDGVSAKSLEGKSKKHIFENYKTWANENGFKHLSSNHFGRELSTIFSFESPRRLFDNERIRVYENVTRIKGCDPYEDEQLEIKEEVPF